MKHIKKFELKVFSEDADYPQVYKISNLIKFNLLHNLRDLNKLKFKLDDYVKIDNKEYKYLAKSRIYIIKEIDLDNPINRYKISEITPEIYYKTNKFKFTDDDFYVNENHIKHATTKEVEDYIISLETNKYNL